jgi:sirohydrochlorin ferrochelatase
MDHDRAIILVDHGSRREAANRHLEGLAALVAGERSDWVIRIAHLELAEPSVPAVIDDCVAVGAREVILHPFFLLPGRHTVVDLPEHAEAARRRHPGVTFRITETLGLDPRLVSIVLDRIDEAVEATARASDEA